MRGKDNSGRMYRGGGPRPDKTSLKRQEALDRQKARNARSVDEQIELVQSRRGESKREMEKLSQEWEFEHNS